MIGSCTSGPDTLTPIMPRKFVWTTAVPLRVSFDPPAEVKFGEMVMSVTSGRLNSELKVFVASVCRWASFPSPHFLTSISTVASRATWIRPH
jgi:hypothetical protein